MRAGAVDSYLYLQFSLTLKIALVHGTRVCISNLPLNIFDLHAVQVHHQPLEASIMFFASAVLKRSLELEGRNCCI